jgi:EPS-associated MarR family transcriptional regulator
LGTGFLVLATGFLVLVLVAGFLVLAGAAEPPLGVADEIGYSLGKVNYALKNLIDKGLIKTQRFVNSENKIQYKYLLTPKGIKEKIEITEKFIAIKKAEYDELQKELEVLKGLGEN